MVRPTKTVKLTLSAVMLSWVFYASTARLVWLFAPRAPLPVTPVTMLEPFRIADQYGLFAVMTRGVMRSSSKDRKTEGAGLRIRFDTSRRH